MSQSICVGLYLRYALPSLSSDETCPIVVYIVYALKEAGCVRCSPKKIKNTLYCSVLQPASLKTTLNVIYPQALHIDNVPPFENRINCLIPHVLVCKLLGPLLTVES